MSQNQGGDALARGAVRFQFQPAGSKVSQKKWDDIFGDFNAEKYRRDANAEKNGNVSAVARKTRTTKTGI